MRSGRGMSKYTLADLPVGYRFQPTDEELITHYLRRKIIGNSDVDDVITEVDFCLDPWDLPAKSRVDSDDQTWWFFCRRESNKRPKRKTESGYWKITGKGSKIKARDNKTCIGKKKILVFHMGGRGTNWVMHEYYLEPQGPYVICRLENKAAKKAGSPDCDEGEPSSSVDIADVKNPVTPAANSEVHDCAEENADSLAQTLFDQQVNSNMHKNNPEPENSPPQVHGYAEENVDSLTQPLVSPYDFLTEGDKILDFLDGLTEEDIGSIFSDCPKDDQQVNLEMHENHPEPENSPPQVHGCAEENAHSLTQPLVSPYDFLTEGDKISDFLDGLTEEDIGSIFSDCPKDDQQVNSDMHENHPEPENSPPQVHGCVEENADSLTQPVFSPYGFLTDYKIADFVDGLIEEDGRSIFSDGLKDDQQVNLDMHKSHPEPENSPPQGPYVISSLENKTEEKAGTPGCYRGEQSEGIISGIGNQIPPTAILEVHGQAGVNDDQDRVHASFGADKPKELPAEFWDRLCENCPGETTSILFNDYHQPTSLKRSHPLDVPASVDADVVGVHERFKRSRSLAPGELLL